MKECKDVTTMNDAIIHIGKGSLVQHGKHNDRVYLLKLSAEDVDSIVGNLTCLAEERHYSKIFCKISKKVAPLFLAEGYLLEGYIPGFYQGKEDAFFVSKFLSEARLREVPSSLLEELYRLLSTSQREAAVVKQPAGYSFRRLKTADVDAMVSIYSEVFSSYPFPISDPAYILKTMEENVQYFGAFKDGNLAAVASSEMDVDAMNAEMTDFATHRAHTGHGLAYHLLRLMEEEMKRQGILTLYTIARLHSIPMNKTFLRMGYEYSGTLINNTHIAGGIESMVLYYKR